MRSVIILLALFCAAFAAPSSHRDKPKSNAISKSNGTSSTGGKQGVPLPYYQLTPLSKSRTGYHGSGASTGYRPPKSGVSINTGGYNIGPQGVSREIGYGGYSTAHPTTPAQTTWTPIISPSGGGGGGGGGPGYYGNGPNTGYGGGANTGYHGYGPNTGYGGGANTGYYGSGPNIGYGGGGGANTGYFGNGATGYGGGAGYYGNGPSTGYGGGANTGYYGYRPNSGGPGANFNNGGFGIGPYGVNGNLGYGGYSGTGPIGPVPINSIAPETWGPIISYGGGGGGAGAGYGPSGGSGVTVNTGGFNIGPSGGVSREINWYGINSPSYPQPKAWSPLQPASSSWAKTQAVPTSQLSCPRCVRV